MEVLFFQMEILFFRRQKCQENALLLISCGENDLRFLPPLILQKEHIDEMSEKLRKALKSF